MISAQQQGESLISAQQQGESLIPAQQQGQSLIPAQQQGESLIPVPFSGALTTRQTSVWTPPTYNTKPQLMRLAVPDTETNSPTEAPTSSTIVIPSSIDSSSEKLDASKNQPVNSFSENPPKVTLNSATVHCSTVSTLPEILVTTSASPQISRATTTATPDIAMATVTLPQIAMTSSGHPQIAMTSSGHPQIAMTSSGPHQIALTSPGIQQISMTSSGPPQIAMTTPVPQIVATLPVQPGKIVATVGQSSDNTLVAGEHSIVVNKNFTFSKFTAKADLFLFKPQKLTLSQAKDLKQPHLLPDRTNVYTTNLPLHRPASACPRDNHQ